MGTDSVDRFPNFSYIGMQLWKEKARHIYGGISF